MINRILIRVKVLQIVYSYYQQGNGNLNSAENELLRSLQKSYDLYHYFLLLIPMLTDMLQRKIDASKHKYLPTEGELDPNTRLIDNRFSEQLRTNDVLVRFGNRHGSLWMEEDSAFMRDLLNEILQSDIYKLYLKTPDTYESDRFFWQRVFKTIIFESDLLFDILGEKDIYWNGGMEIVCTFVMKTIKQFEAKMTRYQELIPMFKNEDDRLFATRLLHKTIIEHDANEALINRQIENWDLERIALIDLYIMQIALSEIKNFPSIPVNVTLNEYIDMARYYSTPKSGIFVNGILDSIVNELRTSDLLFKD
ncbi:MAG: transcription antitermination factor NusB [Dysgonamonadaceae bacterium]|jgi:N utilization substance protein B|nr:transcription antitermination factor NusB [Dysgonamonadaceae bacterium]